MVHIYFAESQFIDIRVRRKNRFYNIFKKHFHFTNICFIFVSINFTLNISDVLSFNNILNSLTDDNYNNII